jgi:hypothetical protein
MSNRGRQNVASFLAKDLEYDWRIGAEFFESHLLDHEVRAQSSLLFATSADSFPFLVTSPLPITATGLT